MNSSHEPTAPASVAGSITSRTAAAGDDVLLGDAFGAPAPATSPRPNAPAARAEAAPVLRLAVKGLKPIERQLLEGLVKVSQRRTPRLQILDDALACEADVIVVDTRDAAAMAWAHARPWLARRAVIWIDGTEAARGHTLLRRPVQWPILPMVLARALESGPATAATSPTAAPQATLAPRRADTHTPQLLVVDDSLAVRAHLRSLLEPAGYQVTEADCVAAALEQIEQHRFDGVLMDVLMPQVDGYEGCRRVKARLRGADAVPVVMLTSNESPFDRIRCTMAGADAHLAKPIDAQHLREVMAQQVPVPGAAGAPAGAIEIPTRRY